MYTVDINGTKQPIVEKFSYNAPTRPLIRKDNDNDSSDSPSSEEGGMSNAVKYTLISLAVLVLLVVSYMLYKASVGKPTIFRMRRHQRFGFNF